MYRSTSNLFEATWPIMPEQTKSKRIKNTYKMVIAQNTLFGIAVVIIITILSP